MMSGFYDNHASNPRNSSMANLIPAATAYRDKCRAELKATLALRQSLTTYFLQARAAFDTVNVTLNRIEDRLFRHE